MAEINLQTLLKDLNGQSDAVLLLLTNATNTQNGEMLIESSVDNVIEGWSEGASNSISGGNYEMDQQVASMKSLTGSNLQRAMGVYQTMQTKISLNNQLYSSVMDGGTTDETNLTQAMSQELQFATSVLEQLDNTNQLIMGWAS